LQEQENCKNSNFHHFSNSKLILLIVFQRYAIGCRNFYVRKYSDAADDLSEASKLFGEVYGIDGAELGDVYLMYAKSLIQIGQEENKLIDVPEEDEDGEDEAEPVENGVDEGEGDEEGN
jgi:nuclear autoantigenic sperm protein